MYDPFRGRLKIHDEEKCLGISPFTSKNKEECPMKGRMCQCSAKENCIHIDKNKEEAEYEKESCTHYPRCDKPCTPQSPLSEKECNCTISPRNVHYKDCPLVAPSSNEDWMIKFYEQFGANKIWVTPSRDNVQTIFEIENFIRQQRLGAQRELTEEIINYMEDGLDEPTDWYVSVKNFLSSRGLLPKITE